MFTSKIPVLAKSNNRRDSISKPDSIRPQNETRRPLSRIRNSQHSTQNTPMQKNSKSDIFKTQPTIASLNSRKLPNDLQGNQKIIGNPTAVESLYRYLKYITQPYFVPEFQARVFPKALSVLHQITVSKYESKKNVKKNPRTSIAVATEITDNDAKPKDLDLSPVFNEFKQMMRKQKNTLKSLTDFLLLYCAYLIIVCEGDTDNVLQPLFFLKQFLQLDLPKRKQEADILGSVLMKQAESDPTVRGHSIQVLSLFVGYDSTMLNRIKAGCEYHDKNFSEFCKSILNDVQRTIPTDQVLAPPPPTFAEISPNANITISNEMLTSFLSAFENGEKPRDPSNFIHNIIQTMQRFANSPSILEKGSNNIGIALNLLLPDPPTETVSEIMKLCFLLLSGESFLTGDNSFEALEAIQTLSNNVFEIVPSQILIPAITATIAMTTDSHLHLLMRKFSEYYQNNRGEISQRQLNDIASTLDAFHPDFNERPPFLNTNAGFDSKLNSMTESIERLLNPETVFTEMESIIQQDPEILNDYPLYLRGFLQRAYFLYHSEEPVGMSEDQRLAAEEMVREMGSIKEEDLVNGGKYSVETLSAKLEEIKAYTNLW